MKLKISLGIPSITAGALLAADSGPKDEVAAAAKKLAEASNYSWKSVVEFGNFTGTTDGKAEKEGLIGLSMAFGENRINQGGGAGSSQQKAQLK